MSSNVSQSTVDCGDPHLDAIGRTIQVALAIYLVPVIAIVCAVGAAAILVERVSKLTARRSTNVPTAISPCHVSVHPAGWAGMKLMPHQPSERIRV